MENINLIRKVAWKFHNKTDMEFDELFQEAALTYCEAIEHFSEDMNTKPTTYAWQCMANHLNNICEYPNYYVDPKTGNTVTKSKADRFPKNEFPTHLHPKVSMPTPIEETIAEWPKDCQEAAKTVFENPERFLGETPNFSRNGTTPLQRIKNALKQKGWTCSRVQETINQMKTLISTL